MYQRPNLKLCVKCNRPISPKDLKRVFVEQKLKTYNIWDSKYIYYHKKCYETLKLKPKIKSKNEKS